ncbi:MAG: hypothetical protein ACOYCA_03035 [Eggerthellaceae bacterium]|jgi:hypothetical protein
MPEIYEGFYARFETYSKTDAAILLGANCLVGDEFEIRIEKDKTPERAVLFNKFDTNIGYFNNKDTRKIRLLLARGWKVRAVLSLVCFSENDDEGEYWGEMAVFGYDPKHEEAFDNFVKGISEVIASGTRLKIDLGAQMAERIVETNGDWLPSQKLPKQKKKEGTAIIKDHRTATESLVEQGRKGNKGCYVVSWIFLLAVVAAVVYGLKSCGVF